MEFISAHPAIAIAALSIPLLLLVAQRRLARRRWLKVGQQVYGAMTDGAIASEDVEHLLGDGSLRG